MQIGIRNLHLPLEREREGRCFVRRDQDWTKDLYILVKDIGDFGWPGHSLHPSINNKPLPHAQQHKLQNLFLRNLITDFFLSLVYNKHTPKSLSLHFLFYTDIRDGVIKIRLKYLAYARWILCILTLALSLSLSKLFKQGGEKDDEYSRGNWNRTPLSWQRVMSINVLTGLMLSCKQHTSTGKTYPIPHMPPPPLAICIQDNLSWLYLWTNSIIRFPTGLSY